VTIALENMPANINATCTSPEELLRVLDGTELGICFDVGHANTTGNIDTFLPLAHRFINVHLHNNGGQWDEHNVIDDGSADVAKVVSALKGSYKGNIVIESTDLETGIISKGKLEALLR
jgi:sugar phosphate isomerase/epimerase